LIPTYTHKEGADGGYRMKEHMEAANGTYDRLQGLVDKLDPKMKEILSNVVE